MDLDIKLKLKLIIFKTLYLMLKVFIQINFVNYLTKIFSNNPK